MKKAYLLILLVMLFAGAKAGVVKHDSITDSWSVTYNGKEILAFKINSVQTYLIDTIADSSWITVDYYTEQPCEKCQSRLQFRDEDGKAMATLEKKGFGSGNPFRFPGKTFRQMMRNHKMFLYFSANPDGWGTWVFLGIVQTNKH